LRCTPYHGHEVAYGTQVASRFALRATGPFFHGRDERHFLHNDEVVEMWFSCRATRSSSLPLFLNALFWILCFDLAIFFLSSTFFSHSLIFMNQKVYLFITSFAGFFPDPCFGGHSTLPHLLLFQVLSEFLVFYSWVAFLVIFVCCVFFFWILLYIITLRLPSGLVPSKLTPPTHRILFFPFFRIDGLRLIYRS